MSIFTRLFGRKGKTHTSQGTPRQPVDVNTPVENPYLVVAMLNFAWSPSAQSEQELIRQLRHAIFIVPILDDEMRTTPGMQLGNITIQQGSFIKIPFCRDQSGAENLPLFTDWDAIHKWTQQQVSTLVMPAGDAWSFVLSQAHYAGAIINPGDAAFPLPRPMIEYLRGESNPD